MVFPKHRYFNCSDGVKIEGAKPTPSGNITLGEPLNKTLIVSGIVGNMPVYTLDAFSSRWNKDDLVRQVGKFQDDILSLVKEMTTPGDKRSEKERLSSNCFEAILRVTRYFYPLSEKQDRDYAPKPDLITDHEQLLHETLENLYRGTLFMSMGTATYFLNRITDRKRLPELHSHLSQYLQETIGKMAEASIDTFTKLQAELEAVALPPNDAMERVQ